MSDFPGSPRLVRGGLVLLDPGSGLVRRVIALQYNPDTVTRTLQPQGIGAEPGDRLEALRFKGPPQETIRIEAEIDATDRLERPTASPRHERATRLGLLPELAALETLVAPTTAQLLSNDALAGLGAIEIAPAESPLPVFVWGKSRVVPVRITEFTITEEAFDSLLHPIRAKFTLGLRVLTVNDLGFAHRGGSLFLLQQQQRERLAAASEAPDLTILGITAIQGA
jgi:hypothetical protein